MTITLGALVQAMPVLNKLAAQELPVRESYRLAKLTDEQKAIGTAKDWTVA